MKREILFRGKSIDKNEFIYGLPYSSCYDEEIDQIVVHDYHVDIRPETIGQFTGLSDKNGVKIFEGDMFNINGKTMFIEYIEDRCCYVLTTGLGYDTKNAIDLDCDIIYQEEIIGNIHE